jgi:hypothetical protein
VLNPHASKRSGFPLRGSYNSHKNTRFHGDQESFRIDGESHVSCNLSTAPRLTTCTKIPDSTATRKIPKSTKDLTYRQLEDGHTAPTTCAKILNSTATRKISEPTKDSRIW